MIKLQAKQLIKAIQEQEVKNPVQVQQKQNIEYLYKEKMKVPKQKHGVIIGPGRKVITELMTKTSIDFTLT